MIEFDSQLTYYLFLYFSGKLVEVEKKKISKAVQGGSYTKFGDMVG